MEGSAVVKNNWLDFGSDPDHHADCPIGNPTITQQIMNGLWWNFMEGSEVVKGTRA